MNVSIDVEVLRKERREKRYPMRFRDTLRFSRECDEIFKPHRSETIYDY